MSISLGDITFVGMNTNGTDWFAFAALNNIAGGSVIYFTDNELPNSNSTSFNGTNSVSDVGETFMKWVAPAGGVAAGTVIRIDVPGTYVANGSLTTTTGTTTFIPFNGTGSANADKNSGMSATQETIYAYTAASDATIATPVTHLAYISVGNAPDPIPTSLPSSYAITVSDGSDSAYYSGVHSGYPNITDYAALIGNVASNWTKGAGETTAATLNASAFVATPPGSLSVSDVSVTEGNSGTKVMTFTVTLSSANVQSVTVDYATQDNTATAGSDYAAASGTLTFAPGDLTKTVSITINGDTDLESNETFKLHLSNPTVATIGSADGTGTITNDDLTLQGDDHYTITSGQTLSTSGTPVTWDESVAATAGGVVLSNAGTIESTGATAIDAPASAPASGSSSFALTNTGTVTGASNGIHVASGLNGGTFSVDNSGTINGTATRAIDVASFSGAETVSVTNETGGVIHSANDAIRVTGTGTFTGTISIDNSGTIAALGSGQGVDLTDIVATEAGHITVTNHAGATISAADNDGLRAGAYALIENYGSILASNVPGNVTADGIDGQSNQGIVINNHAGAVIDGARHGVTGNFPMQIDNAGTITGHAGSGLNMDTPGDTVMTIVNEATGVITGTTVEGRDGDGIDVDGQVNITNYGTVQTFGHSDGETNEGLAIGGGIVTNYGTIYSDERGIRADDSNLGNAFAGTTIINHGTITGNTLEAISITDFQGDTITNDGTINGDIITGSGDDTVTNTGTINGTIHTGSGNDAIIGGAGNNAFDGGAGNDTVNGGAGDDTAVFGGNIADSTITRVGTTFTVTGTDGTDTITNVEHFQFANGTVDALSINDAPVIGSNGGDVTAAVSVAENTAAVTTVQATDANSDGVTYSITGGADAALFQINAATGALSFKQAPNFEIKADAGHDNVYDVTVSASDGTLSDTQAIAVTVTDVADTHSSKAAYLLSSNSDVSIQAIITTGDATSKVGGGTYLFGGIPDGLGMFDNGDGTVTVLVNQEIGNTLGTVRADGAKGAYVSELVIDKTTLEVISGQDAIQTLKVWDAVNHQYVVSTAALSRFCSADLPAQSALYNANDGLGSQAKIFFTGEESGAEGKQLGVVITGSEAGTAYELPWLGKFSHENAVANAYAQDKTIILGTDDAGGGKGQVYVYVGTKTSSGTEVDKAGLTNGVLYGFAVTGLAQETATTNLQNATFTLAALGDVSGKTGAQLETDSTAAGVTQFLRPEDIAWDPSNAARGYFVVTDNVNPNGTATTPTVYHSRLYQFTFTDITHPELGGKITAVLDGTEGQVMFDNITVDAQGLVTLCEDPGNNVRVGRVWQYNPTTDHLTELAHHDPALFLQNTDPLQPGYTPNPATFLTQDEESSGVLDVTSTFGDAHHKAFLIDTQNHAVATGSNAATLVEGGQLQLITQYYNDAPVIGSNGGDVTAAVSVAENTAAVTTVQATDANSDGVTYSITGGADAALFQINAATGALSFKQAPNFEIKADAGHDNVYDVTVSASDGTLSDTQAIAVTVTDVADTHSSKAAYLLSSNSDVSIQAIITTGDATSKVGGGTYLFGGIPDGLGMFDNGDGTVTVLVNQEIGNTLGTVRADGAKGAYVSELVIDKTTLEVISGQDAIQTLKVWDAVNHQYVVSTAALSRFCSADLPAQSALYNANDGLGSQAKIFFTGEESGAEGKQLGVVITGSEAGTAYELPWLGKFSHENAVANAYAQDKTIILGTDDAGGGKGQVYVYVGTKTSSGTEVDKAGLTNGVLYGFAVTGLAQETATTNLQNATFTLAALGDVSGKTGAQLETDSTAAGVTQFLRPEDIAWDPSNAARGYFVVTDNVNPNGTATTPTVYHSRLYQFTFTDITHPELGGKITAVLDGTEGQVMFDNITVDAQGLVTLCEDPGNNVRVGRVWQYNPTTDHLTELAHHDPALFLQNTDPLQPGYTPNPATFLTQDEESSGVLDVTSTFGDAHHKAFLIDTQNHAVATGSNAATLVEGGQLQLITQYYNDAPVLTGAKATLAHGTEDTAYTVSLAQLLAGFTDTNNDIIAVSGLSADHGTVTDNGNGTYTITPTANYNGSATLSYSVIDGQGGQVAASLGYVIDEVVDTFTGTSGNDTLIGTIGADILIGLAGNDRLNGGAGSDTASYAGASAGVTVDLRISSGQSTGGAGTDTLVSIENLTGSSFSDKLTGNEGANTLDGGSGNDKLYGFTGNDHLLGGAGDDTLDGGTGADTMEGGIGKDAYYVDNSGDVVIESNPSGGTDTVYSSVSFTLSANVENLTLTSGSATVGTGNALANTLQSSDIASTLWGLAGNDVLRGGAGADHLYGGAGKDVLTGGAGADTFVFDVFETSANRDTITDFVSGSDKIVLSVSAFGGLASYGLGTLDAGELAFGTAANVPGQHLIYNPLNGALFYDADGYGGAAQVQIALLSGHPGLVASDIVLI